jgi:adenylate cyclase class 1
MRENLIHNIETLVCNSWGEVVGARYSGAEGLVRCARDFLQQRGGPGEAAPSVVIRCLCASRAAPIAARVEELLTDLGEAFPRVDGQGDLRYVLAVGKSFHVMDTRAGTLQSRSADDEEQLLGLLGEPGPAWSRLVIDRHALSGSPLPVIATRMAPGRVDVFCETRADGTRVVVADERGALYSIHYAGLTEKSALAALARFLVSVRFRQGATTRGSSGLAGPATLRFHRLVRGQGTTDYAVQPLQEAPDAAGNCLQIQAIAEPASDSGRVYYTIWCEGESFSQRELGERFHRELAAYVLARRGNAERYPVYLTDLDLSALETAPAGMLQTIHYLRHRQVLEDAISAALGNRA